MVIKRAISDPEQILYRRNPTQHRTERHTFCKTHSWRNRIPYIHVNLLLRFNFCGYRW